MLTLDGGPVIPETFIQAMSLTVRCKPRAMMAGTRRLLWMADRAESRFSKAREVFQYQEPSEVAAVPTVGELQDMISAVTPPGPNAEKMPDGAGPSAEVMMPPGYDVDEGPSGV